MRDRESLAAGEDDGATGAGGGEATKRGAAGAGTGAGSDLAGAEEPVLIRTLPVAS